jgi:NMT1/THI5 like
LFFCYNQTKKLIAAQTLPPLSSRVLSAGRPFLFIFSMASFPYPRELPITLGAARIFYRTAAILIAALLALVPPLAGDQTVPQRVVVTYSSRSIASIDLFVAQERGFFREEGLEAQLVQVRANSAISAIVSGEVHALGSIGSEFGQSRGERRQSARGQLAPADLLARQPARAEEFRRPRG